MPLDFPSSPSNGDTYENYIYDSTAGVWKRISNPTGSLENLDDVDLTTPAMGDSLVYDGTDWVNGPRSGNAVINGDFGIAQRGTSVPITNNTYTLDRMKSIVDADPTTANVVQRELDPAEINAIGYGDIQHCMSAQFTTVGSLTRFDFRNLIEDVRTFAGQEVTLSFWAKGSSARSGIWLLLQDFGSGGSGDVNSTPGFVWPTTWTRVTQTFMLGGISGKTINAGSFLSAGVRVSNPADGETFEITGVQLEAGPVATPFRLAGGGSKAAELALCQRYFQKSYDLAEALGSATSASTAQSRGLWSIHMPGATIGNNRTRSMPRSLPVQMRAAPTVKVWDTAGNINRFTAMDANGGGVATNVAFDTFGGVVATETSVGLQTVTGNSTYRGAMVNYQLSAELS